MIFKQELVAWEVRKDEENDCTIHVDSKVGHFLSQKPVSVIIELSKAREKKARVWMSGKLRRIWEKTGKEESQSEYNDEFSIGKNKIVINEIKFNT